MRLVAAGAAFLAGACEVPAPTADTTPPEITVIVSRGRGGNIFRSADGELEPGQDCIKVPDTPAQLSFIVGDAGGVQTAVLKAFPGPIVPGSVVVSPGAPVGSSSIRSERGADFLEITLTPPSPDTVMTGAAAVLEVDGDLPIAITASARDHAGNVADLSQLELRALNDAVICRGE